MQLHGQCSSSRPLRPVSSGQHPGCIALTYLRSHLCRSDVQHHSFLVIPHAILQGHRGLLGPAVGLLRSPRPQVKRLTSKPDSSRRDASRCQGCERWGCEKMSMHGSQLARYRRGSVINMDMRRTHSRASCNTPAKGPLSATFLSKLRAAMHALLHHTIFYSLIS